MSQYETLRKDSDFTTQIQHMWDASIYMYAIHLKEGYDDAHHEQFLCNAKNEILEIVPQMESRVPDTCKRRIEQDINTRASSVWRSNPFTDGGKKRRKTKKRTKKTKKTLRRK